jgi:hypothetical protein
LQPLGTLDESVSFETSSAEYFDFAEYFNPSPLTAQVHEPPTCFLSGINLPTEEALADNSQSQFSHETLLHGVQQPSPTPTHTPTPTKAPGTSTETYPSPISLPSPDLSTIPSGSPPDTRHVSVEAPDGKKAIESTRSKVCTTCTKSFSASRYQHHINRHECKPATECQQCGEPIKHLKDLKRHLGSSKAAPACPVLKAAGYHSKHFACICSTKTYTRKDSLLRHFRTTASDVSQEHRCKACDRFPCACS